LGAAVAILATACSSSAGSEAGASPAAQGGSTCNASGPTSSNSGVAAAQAALKKAEDPSSAWDGPTAGPTAQKKGSTVVFIPAESSNAGDLGVEKGFEEAAAAIGWKTKVIDGGGTTASNLAAFEQALGLRPAAIAVSSFDTASAARDFAKAKALGIPVIGNHTGTNAGPQPGVPGLFTNITSDPETISRVAADCAIVASNGTAGVTVVGCGTEVAICQTKENAIVDEMKKCSGCTVLAHEDYAFEDASQREGVIAAADYQKFGKKLTYMLSINDIYYDAAIPALKALGVGPAGPPLMIAAGDGSPTAFQRIRQNQYQIATVAEPLNEHGWQMVDEMNRALAGVAPTTYVTYPHIVTSSNVNEDGGKADTYDPANGYRDQYKKIWGAN